jgi:16S rRNA (cytosine1402-N4)-methyltransferase
METSGEEAKPVAFLHVPVLSRELIEGLDIRPGGHYLDATVGGGGHSQLILEAASDVHVTAIDRDAEAITAAKTKLENYGDRVHFWQGNFAEYKPFNQQFDGIIADLGVSSAQFDIPERGFSFRHAADLDMRMDQRQSLTAADVINRWDEAQLAMRFTSTEKNGYLGKLHGGLSNNVHFKGLINWQKRSLIVSLVNIAMAEFIQLPAFFKP